MRHNPLATGSAFATTAGLLYLLCTLTVALVPDMLVRVLRVFVHGLNTAPLAAGAPPMGVADAVLGLVFIVVYAFIAGLVYARASNVFAPRGLSK